jgi:hypothetical protein
MESVMAKFLVLYYSSYGHVEALAGAVAEGARSAGATVDIRRVPETAPEEVAKAAYFKLDQQAPVATVAELANYDAIVVGTPTRFGRISSQMAAFLDQAGGLWMSGASRVRWNDDRGTAQGLSIVKFAYRTERSGIGDAPHHASKAGRRRSPYAPLASSNDRSTRHHCSLSRKLTQKSIRPHSQSPLSPMP